jgi:Holliday junction resolvase-like predicted endonuclease
MSEDLLTGSVFGTLKNLNWRFGLKPFLESVTGQQYPIDEFESPEFYFWNRVEVYRKGEGSTEVDLIIKLKSTLFFIEAKYGAEASKGTTNEKDRNQLTRNLELGRQYVKDTEQEHFHLIYITPDKITPEKAVNYLNETDLSWTNWGQIAKTLQQNIDYFTVSERRLAGDLIDYLAYKGFHDQPYSNPEDRMKINEKTRYKTTLTRLTEGEKTSLLKIMQYHNLDILRDTHYFYWGKGLSLKTRNPDKTIFSIYPNRKQRFQPKAETIKNLKSMEEYIARAVRAS